MGALAQKNLKAGRTFLLGHLLTPPYPSPSRLPQRNFLDGPSGPFSAANYLSSPTVDSRKPTFPSDLIWILYRLSGHFPKQKKKTGLSSQENRCWLLLSLAVTLHGPLDSSQRHPMTLCDTGFLCLFPNLTACCLTTPCYVYVFLPSKVWSQWFIELTRKEWIHPLWQD